MRLYLVVIGLTAFLAAFSLWVTGKTQPEDIPLYSRAHRKLSKKDLYIEAILFLIAGIVLVTAGLTFD